MLARFISALPTVVDTMAAICRPNKKRTVARMMMVPRLVEVKYFDTTRGAAGVPNTGVVDPFLLGMQQGTGNSGRVGRLVRVTCLEIIGNASIAVTDNSAQTWDALRIMVVHDKQCNGALFGITDLMVSGDEKNFTNPNNELRFDILKEQIFSVNASSSVNTSGNPALALQTGEAGQWFRYKIPLDLVVEYSASTGAVADLRSSNLAVYATSRNGRGVIEYIARVSYTDA